MRGSSLGAVVAGAPMAWACAWLCMVALRRAEEHYLSLRREIIEDRAATLSLGALSLPASLVCLATWLLLQGLARCTGYICSTSLY